MAVRNIGSSYSTQVIPRVYFTMVDINQDRRAQTDDTNVITNVVIQGVDNQSNYAPDQRSSVYLEGTINSMLFSEDHTQVGWEMSLPLRNDAVVNQAALLTSLGSVSMQNSLGTAMSALREEIVRSLPEETSEREAIQMTREIEQAICESAVRSPNFEAFQEALQEEYQTTYGSSRVLAHAYDQLQYLPTHWNYSDVPAHELVNWIDVANGFAPVVNPPRRDIETTLDPMTSVTFEAENVCPGSGLVVYEMQAQNMNNVVVVNNLFFSAAQASMQSANYSTNLASQAQEQNQAANPALSMTVPMASMGGGSSAY